MVDEQLIAKLQQILKKMQTKKGHVYLFMIVKMDEVTDKWSVIISAPWININNKSEMFKYISSLLRDSLTDEEKLSISRISVFDPSNIIVTQLTSAIKLEQGVTKIQNTKINGNFIYEAYILHAIPPLAK